MIQPAQLDDPNLAMIEIVAHALNDLCDAVVLVGGCATGLLITGARAQRIRATADVDLVAEVATIHDYHEMERELTQRQFRPDTSPDAPICRWIGSGVAIDLMPSQPGVLSFHNPWYPLAVTSANHLELPSGRLIRLIAAPAFIATKLVAFHDRGREDLIASHDLEDIITVIDGRASLTDEINAADIELRHFLAEQFTLFLKSHAFLDALPGHLPGDAASQARIPTLISRIRGIAQC